MQTIGQVLCKAADDLGMPLRTLADVTADLADAKRRSKGKNADMDVALARLMLRHGRLSCQAVTYVQAYLEGAK
jgi:hypothetical protein